MNTSETDDDEEASETKPPPYIPPSILEKRVKWDVFLSFRGEDTRTPFTTELRGSLKSKGLTPFMDDEGMERGDIIQPSLDEAIIDSALAIAIISPNYADSHWCVEELFRIFKSRKRVIPVFYHVDPLDVRDQSGVFVDGFMKIVGDQRFKEKEIKRWRNALKNVGTISGFEIPIQSSLEDEEKFRQRIVREVWSELKGTNAVKLEVGLDVRVDKVVDILDLNRNDVRFMNIHGAPGIGKTTLAKAVYNKLSTKFIKRFFISNINERLNSEEGILSVKNELMRGLGNELNRVLLVLDDVLEARQLDDLLGIVKKWFHKGSKIIVTSRNREVLLNLDYSYELYEVDPLNESESLELFSIYAFGRRKPKLELKKVSYEIVSLLGGLPLALEVFGSFLVNKKTKSECKDALTKLKSIDRSQNLQNVLKISYDGLEDQEKTVFLDISCLLLQNDKKREDIVDILAGCDLSAELAVGNLVTKSLLKITEQDKLWMHDQIRDLGRQIVIEKSSNNIWNHSRVWDSAEEICLLRQNMMTEAVRGIVLDIKKPLDHFTAEDNSVVYNWFNLAMIKPYIISILKGLITSSQKPDENNDNGKVVLDTKWFEKMNKLKLLQMDNAKVEGDFKDMPCDLRWLQWRGCTEKALPTNLPEGLRVLDLSGSNIEHLWSSNHLPRRGFSKVVVNLMVINLSNCRKLKSLPDMSGHKHLRKINLENCERLVKIDDSIGHMNYLVYLNLRGCKNLAEFPGDVTGMKNLEELILSDCSKLCAIPENLKSMKSSLTQLFLDGTSITKLPNTLFQLTQLQVLNVRNCHKLTLLPGDNLQSLTNLVTLN